MTAQKHTQVKQEDVFAKEHYSSFINNKLDSNYGIHLQESQHNFNQNFQILHLQNKGQKLNLLEALEINKLKKFTIST